MLIAWILKPLPAYTEPPSCLKQCGFLAHRYWSTHSHFQTARIRELCSIRTVLTVIPGIAWHSRKHTEFQCPALVVSLSVSITFWNLIIDCIMGIKLGAVLWPWKRICKLPNIFLIMVHFLAIYQTQWIPFIAKIADWSSSQIGSLLS